MEGLVQSASHRLPSVRLYSSDKHGTDHQVIHRHMQSQWTWAGSYPLVKVWENWRITCLGCTCFSAEGMKAGNYGNLLVLIEQPRGEYSVTIAFLRLVTTLVKVIHLSVMWKWSIITAIHSLFCRCVTVFVYTQAAHESAVFSVSERLGSQQMLDPTRVGYHLNLNNSDCAYQFRLQ